MSHMYICIAELKHFISLGLLGRKENTLHVQYLSTVFKMLKFFGTTRLLFKNTK